MMLHLPPAIETGLVCNPSLGKRFFQQPAEPAIGIAIAPLYLREYVELHSHPLLHNRRYIN